MLYNFGIEGTSYKMVDGNPIYTELIMKNPQGMTNTQVMSLYMRGHTNGPFIQDKRYIEQYYEKPQQKAATTNWKKNDWSKYIMPPVTPTADESSELAKIMGDITTYSDEMSLKFIMGVEPLSNYDKYVAQIKSMGIDKAIAIYQAAYNRYDSRK
jgi:putative aldouronate transport system substrate-binding protein